MTNPVSPCPDTVESVAHPLDGHISGHLRAARPDPEAVAWFGEGSPFSGPTAYTVRSLLPARLSHAVVVRNGPPPDGPHSLTRAQADRLAELLEPGTASSDGCWFGVWIGYGWFDRTPSQVLRAVSRRPSLRDRVRILRDRAGRRHRSVPAEWVVPVRSREYVFAYGPLRDVSAIIDIHGAGSFQSPNLWWPDSHEWVVVTDIDLEHTIVGCDQGVAALLTADPLLDARPVPDDTPLSSL